MARKAGDLMSLLAHRGAKKRRGKSGGLQKFFSGFGSIVVGKSASGSQSRKAAGTGNMRFAALSLAFLGVGYLLGSAFPWNGGEVGGSLAVSQSNQRLPGVVPGPVGERLDLQPLSSTFLLTAAYENYAPASAAAETLRQSGLRKARPYQLQKGYGLVVYYDGEQAADQLRTRLASVSAPDRTFEDYRKRGKGWPVQGSVR